MMLVTTAAADHLRQNLPEGANAWRMVMAMPRGVTFVPASAQPGDTLIDWQGAPLVVLDAEMADAVDEALLDLAEGELLLHQAKESCGGDGCVSLTLQQWQARRLAGED